MPEWDSTVLEAKKTIFWSRYGLRNFIFLFLVELGTCPQNLIPTRRVEHWEKNQFPQLGMLKFTYKGNFLTIKKAYGKLMYWKSKRWAYTLMPPLHIEIFFPKKIKISNFGGISKFFKLIVFGQISALLGTFGQIWVDFAAFIVAKNMPKLGAEI
jgi:hypothetical protein